MSFSQYPWENRVFRVDRECYLLFLGMDELDEKPFIRIGNSSWLNERVLEAISHTVITESFTGNPFGEVGLTHHYHGRYLGEPGIVEVIKSFFSRFHVTDSEVITYSEQEVREGRDLVYFYNTGNIAVSFDGIRLFDLYAREKADRHYNFYCSEILNIFKKNPLKWGSIDTKGKGFFSTDGSLFFYDNGRLLGLNWDKNYFKTLARSGWNPDKLAGILVDLTSDEMEDGNKSACITNFIKRGISAKNPMTFFSKDHSFNSKIKPLFEYVKSRDVPVHFNDISDQGSFNWQGTHGEWEKGEFSFLLSESVVAKCSDGGQVSVEYRDSRQSCLLIDGVPARIHSESIDLKALCRLYVDETGKMLLKSGLLGQDARFVREISNLTIELFNAIDGGHGLSVPTTKKLNDFKKLSRAAGKKAEEKLAIYAHNCVSLLELCCKGDLETHKQANELAETLKRTVGAPSKQAEDFLYAANYYDVGCFFSAHKLDISPKERETVAEMHDALLQCDKREVDFFFSERKRLEEILSSLQDGTLWEEIKKANDEATIIEDASPSGTSPKEPMQPAKTPEVAPQNPVKGKGSKKGSAKWLVVALILLLLGVGIFLGYDYNIRGGNSYLASFTGIGSSGNAPLVNSEDLTSTTSSGETLGEQGDSTNANLEDKSPWTANGNTADFNREVVTEKADVVIDPRPRDDAHIETKENGEAPEIEFNDHIDTVVTKPLVMDDDFLDNFMIDGVKITMADIHLKANDISVMNGYRDLGFHIVEGNDPTIIEPGQVLKIPGFLTYTVKPDDNIWYIAARLLESEVRSFTIQFDELTSNYESISSLGEDTSELIKKIKALADDSSSENFKKKVESWLNNH